MSNAELDQLAEDYATTLGDGTTKPGSHKDSAYKRNAKASYQAGFRKALAMAYAKLNANRQKEDACAVLVEEFYYFL